MNRIYFAGERQFQRWEDAQPIDFADIFNASVVEPDTDCEAPWENCDGWEHEFIPQHKLPDNLSTYDAKKAAGWTGDGLIVVDPNVVKKQWMGEYSPFSGEHRQVYEEHIAEVRRKAVAQLVKWYKDGYDYWWVYCQFKDETAWMGMIQDDRDGEHLKECRVEMAEEVAYQLEKRGFTVINWPGHPSQREARINQERADIARHMGFEDYKTYRRWVRTPCHWGDVSPRPKRGWPRKNEGARIYRDKDKKVYMLVYIDDNVRHFDAVTGVRASLPYIYLSTINITKAYIADNWLKRVAWYELPARWRQAFGAWLPDGPENVRGLWRVGEQPI